MNRIARWAAAALLGASGASTIVWSPELTIGAARLATTPFSGDDSARDIEAGKVVTVHVSTDDRVPGTEWDPAATRCTVLAPQGDSQTLTFTARQDSTSIPQQYLVGEFTTTESGRHRMTCEGFSRVSFTDDKERDIKDGLGMAGLVILLLPLAMLLFLATFVAFVLAGLTQILLGVRFIAPGFGRRRARSAGMVEGMVTYR